MHAGDGNVHTNIPVNSDDYAMLQAANAAVARIMQLATDLGGVISGEHGIGLTKLEFLDDAAIAIFADYKQKVDPDAPFQQGQAAARRRFAQCLHARRSACWKPSRSSSKPREIGAIADSIKDCLRCGKCKPVCNTHIPRANLLYSPRNKILATSLLIEAFLYEEQTRRGVSLKHFDEFGDVADHCTVCHKCKNPCPVDIDFGDVSIAMRNLLRKQGKKKFNPGTWASMAFLNATDPATIKALRKPLIEWGYAGQRLGHQLFKRLGLIQAQTKHPPATLGKPTLVAAGHSSGQQADAGRAAEENLARAAGAGRSIDRADPAQPGQALGRHPTRCSISPAAARSGCSRRWGSPPRRCCSNSARRPCCRPATCAAATRRPRAARPTRARRSPPHNRVLFHRVANTLNYLDIKTVIVSCGTCMDQLLKYEFDKIFPGCRLLDIHEYLMEKGVKLDGVSGEKYLYHDPCHTPMKTHAPMKVANALLGGVNGWCNCPTAAAANPARSPSPARTSPPRSASARKRKSAPASPHWAQATSRSSSSPAARRACKGWRATATTPAPTPDYIVIELAKKLLGENWMASYLARVGNGGIERVLL